MRAVKTRAVAQSSSLLRSDNTFNFNNLTFSQGCRRSIFGNNCAVSEGFRAVIHHDRLVRSKREQGAVLLNDHFAALQADSVLRWQSLAAQREEIAVNQALQPAIRRSQSVIGQNL